MPLAAHEVHQAHSRSPIMVDTGGGGKESHLPYDGKRGMGGGG